MNSLGSTRLVYTMSIIAVGFHSWVMQDHPLLLWLDNHKLFIKELLQLDGQHDYSGSCALCCTPNPCYICKDCFVRPLYCVNCMLVSHAHNPLHRIKVWDLSLYIRFSNGLGFYRNGMVTSSSQSHSRSLVYTFSWNTSLVINVTIHNHASTTCLWWLTILVFTASPLTSATMRLLWVTCNNFSEWLGSPQWHMLLELLLYFVTSTMMVATDIFMPTYFWGYFQSRTETWHV